MRVGLDAVCEKKGTLHRITDSTTAIAGLRKYLVDLGEDRRTTLMD